MRPQTAPLEVVWVVPGNSYVGAQLLLPVSGRGRIEPVYPAPLKIAKALRGQTFWRWWRLENGEELLIRPRGCLLATPGGRCVGFTVPAPPDWATAGAATVGRWVAALNEQNEWQMAREWLRWTQTQQLAHLVDVRGGSLSELLALLAAAFVLWARHNNKFELDLTQPGPVSLRELWHWPLPEPLAQALSVVRRHWAIERATLDHPTRWWRECDEFGDPMSAPKPTFEWKNASQHQHLEALLLWRDWLQGKLPREQIQKLLESASSLNSAN